MRLVDEVNGGDSGLLPAILLSHLSSGVGTIDPFERYNDSVSLRSYSYSSKIFIPNVTEVRQMLLGGTNMLPLYSRIKWGKQAKSERMTKCFTDGCFSIMNREPWNDCSTWNCKLLKTLQSSLGTEATAEVRTRGEVNTYLFRGDADSGLYISSPAQVGERSRSLRRAAPPWYKFLSSDIWIFCKDIK